MKQKNELLIQLIKTVQLDKPKSDFTENVIDFLKEENKLLVGKDLIYDYQLKKDLLPSLSNDFSTKTMFAIEDATKPPNFKPLLSKKTNTILISVFTAGYFFLLFDAFFLKIFYLTDKTFFKMERLQELLTLSPVFWISILSLTILLLLDSHIKKSLSLDLYNT